ncbi:hypothetical protein GCM10010289_69940 [Streptomyces violascens]|nr:hypothetical protein GCM10010289_69940 [Streptomyces violascens]
MPSAWLAATTYTAGLPLLWTCTRPLPTAVCRVTTLVGRFGDLAEKGLWTEVSHGAWEV